MGLISGVCCVCDSLGIVIELYIYFMEHSQMPILHQVNDFSFFGFVNVLVLVAIIWEKKMGRERRYPGLACVNTS